MPLLSASTIDQISNARTNLDWRESTGQDLRACRFGRRSQGEPGRGRGGGGGGAAGRRTGTMPDMSDGVEQHWTAGSTALVAMAPAADPLVGEARRKYDPAATAGVPAHVTVLYPFLPAGEIDSGVLAELRTLFAGHEPFELDFKEFGRFPDLLWLAPEPDGPLRALTSAVEARWPQAPAYGGRYEPVPHLTIAMGQPQETLAALERELAPGLPLHARITGVHLVVNDDGERWRLRETFALGAAPVGATAEGSVGTDGTAGAGHPQE
jgi:2'-5' RNA ligase